MIFSMVICLSVLTVYFVFVVKKFRFDCGLLSKDLVYYKPGGFAIPLKFQYASLPFFSHSSVYFKQSTLGSRPKITPKKYSEETQFRDNV